MRKGEFAERLVKVEISNRDWGGVDKGKLPASCFLWVEDPEKKTTWHLPVYEGAGAIGEDGMYERRGALNANAVRAARSAVAGGRTGKPMEVPAVVRSTLERLMRLVSGEREEE